MPTVLGVNLSPFVRKVRVALAEKGVPYDLVPVFPQAADEEFRKISPLGKVPALRDGDKGFSDSSVINLYLERSTRPRRSTRRIRSSTRARSGSRSTRTPRW